MANFNADFALVSWHEIKRLGNFVLMKRGTGELGWWHEHNDGTDYWTHPVDHEREKGQYSCRDCGEIFVTDKKGIMGMDTCNNCEHCLENAHYGECGDLYTGYCQLNDKPIDLGDDPCEEYVDA